MDWVHPLCLKTLLNIQKPIPRRLFRTFSVDFTIAFRISWNFHLWSVLFFSQKGYGDSVNGIIWGISKSTVNFFCFAGKPFLCLKNLRFYTKRLVLLESNQRFWKCREWKSCFGFQFKTKKLTVGLPQKVILKFKSIKKNDSGGNWSLTKITPGVADFAPN